MTETFYRVHTAGTPVFHADNAWSGLWGSEWSGDGRQTRCHACDGTGRQLFDEQCDVCDGDGWEDAAFGYSSCRTAADLIAYFAERGEPTDGVVIVYEGRHVGNGFDGEPLSVPDRIIEEISWNEFLARTT